MNLATLSTDPGTLQLASQSLANALISSIWQGFILAAAIALVLKLIPRTTAATRFIIWATAFLVVALLPIFHLSNAAAAAPIPTRHPLLQLNPYWSLAIAALWALLALYRAATLILQGLHLRRLWLQAQPVEALHLLPSGLDLHGARLCTSSAVDRPSLIGFFSPRILIPADLFQSITPAELNHIVLHELQHLRRGDDWINLLQKLSLVLFPLNPVLLWVDKHLCFERELACDDGVIHTTRTPRAYATSLTSLAERSIHRRAAQLTLGAWERRSQLSHRVHSILRRSQTLSPLHSRALLATLILGLFTGAAELSRTPQLISFAAPQPTTETAAATPLTHNSATAIPVVFHAATAPSAPHATLLKATLLKANMDAPSPAVAQPVNQPKTIRHSKPAPAIHTPQRNQNWMVVTSWQEAAPSRITLTVVGDSAFISTFTTVTAVPTDTGWLLVQL